MNSPRKALSILSLLVLIVVLCPLVSFAQSQDEADRLFTDEVKFYPKDAITSQVVVKNYEVNQQGEIICTHTTDKYDVRVKPNCEPVVNGKFFWRCVIVLKTYPQEFGNCPIENEPQFDAFEEAYRKQHDDGNSIKTEEQFNKFEEDYHQQHPNNTYNIDKESQIDEMEQDKQE
jgi:hypothetical protein